MNGLDTIDKIAQIESKRKLGSIPPEIDSAVDMEQLFILVDKDVAKEKLEKNWKVRGFKDQKATGTDLDEHVDRARGYLSSALSYLSN